MINNLTKMKILKPTSEVFEAFVDPTKIGEFWFSSSSERWEQDKTITLEYKEYNATGEIHVLEIVENKKIIFQWGEPGQEHIVTISLTGLDDLSTLVEVNEEGFKEDDPDFLNQLIGNKEGWVFMLTCLKGYLEFGVNQLRTGLAM
ncbi:SRPBCC family protein [Psychrobacillus sp. NPDC096426]|uniref:SRPBCC family protein n=1 Tax=Psychrobacillus sp. NPDC096426 TaxID=3364491 RepID=UPI0037F5033B